MMHRTCDRRPCITCTQNLLHNFAAKILVLYGIGFTTVRSCVVDSHALQKLVLQSRAFCYRRSCFLQKSLWNGEPCLTVALFSSFICCINPTADQCLANVLLRLEQAYLCACVSLFGVCLTDFLSKRPHFLTVFSQEICAQTLILLIPVLAVIQAY